MNMKTSDFSLTLLLDQSPEVVFNAVNNIRGWWSEEIEGKTDTLNEEFEYRYKDVHRCKMRITACTPSSKIEWLVLENYFSFTEDKSEWKGTRIRFEIFQKDNQTQLRFTHLGLGPQYECFEVCRDGWTNYINNSLHSLITAGKGQPNPREGDGFNARLAEKWNLQ